CDRDRDRAGHAYVRAIVLRSDADLLARSCGRVRAGVQSPDLVLSRIPAALERPMGGIRQRRRDRDRCALRPSVPAAPPARDPRHRGGDRPVAPPPPPRIRHPAHAPRRPPPPAPPAHPPPPP